MNASVDGRLRAFFLAVAVAAFAAPPLQSQNPRVLVSTDWLQANLPDASLVVLHVGDDVSYAEGHIPGARLMPPAAFSVERGGLSTEMPEAAVLSEALESAGISNDSRIVIYTTSHPPQPAARLYVTLDYFGLGERTSLLDGGLRAWRAEGRPLSTEPTLSTRGQVELRPRPELLVDHTYLHERLDDPQLAVVDARDTPFWTGAQRNERRAARAGRLPGAHSLPFSTLIDDSGRLLAPGALAALFEQAGIRPGQPIVAYCHVGQQASLLLVAARHLGHDARLYDGSYEDWSRRTELPVEP